jgi:acyl-CoA synthetase (AMP-forming)/AMP-acid ligase II
MSMPVAAAVLSLLAAPVAEAGTLVESATLEHAGLVRWFDYLVPDPLPAGPMPLLLLLHGGTQSVASDRKRRSWKHHDESPGRQSSRLNRRSCARHRKSRSLAPADDPEAALRAFWNLRYHTGDLDRRDEDGDWFFVDRKADSIRYKSRNVSSFAVETAVGAHPDVAQCAAHGVRSAELEHEAAIKVCVVLRPGTTLAPEELARFVNDTAPYFFVPRYIEFVSELPRTPTLRVQKYRLRERGVTPETWDAVRAGFVVRRRAPAAPPSQPFLAAAARRRIALRGQGHRGSITTWG